MPNMIVSNALADALAPPGNMAYNVKVVIPYVEGILPKGPYPPCLRMADRALLAGYPRCVRDWHRVSVWCQINKLINKKTKYEFSCHQLIETHHQVNIFITLLSCINIPLYCWTPKNLCKGHTMTLSRIRFQTAIIFPGNSSSFS